MAAYEVAQIRELQPKGPYYIAGYCAGGAITFGSARQLARAGEVVTRVMLLGCPFPDAYRADPMTKYMRSLRRRVTRHAPALIEGSVVDRVQHARKLLRSRAAAAAERHDPSLENRRRMEDATIAAVKRYHPEPYAGRVDVFFPSEAWRHSGEQAEDWRLVATETVEHVGPDGADGDNMLRETACACTGRPRPFVPQRRAWTGRDRLIRRRLRGGRPVATAAPLTSCRPIGQAPQEPTQGADDERVSRDTRGSAARSRRATGRLPRERGLRVERTGPSRRQCISSIAIR
jgi:thioesterase domain-containing protein